MNSPFHRGRKGDRRARGEDNLPAAAFLSRLYHDRRQRGASRSPGRPFVRGPTVRAPTFCFRCAALDLWEVWVFSQPSLGGIHGPNHPVQAQRQAREPDRGRRAKAPLGPAIRPGADGLQVRVRAGHCGACTVLVDGEPVRSCITPVKEVQGKEVVTIEGLAKKGSLHPVQQAFMEHDALQCGFCTPGMILQAVGLLQQEPAAEPCGDPERPWSTTSAAAGPTRESSSHPVRGRCHEGRKEANENDEYLELDFSDGSRDPFTADRREFLKILGGGIFIFVSPRGCGGPGAGETQRGLRPADALRFQRLSAGSARTAASPASPARSRWDKASSLRWPRCWPTS